VKRATTVAGAGVLALLAMTVPPVVTAPPAAATARPPFQETLPDLQIEVPTSAISIGTNPDTGDTQLQFTHITWDAGAGPFVITPKYHPRTGTATFTQTIYKSRGGTTWSKDFKVPLAVTGIFDPPSDYRYPLTRFTLNDVNNDGSLGAVVATSPKSDYCITADAFVGGVPNTPDNTTPPQSDCVHPNKALGFSVGWGDEYDQTDNGQPIDLTGIPDGTYILHAEVDPQHIFVESDASNDVTDTLLTISQGNVTVLSQTGPPQSVSQVHLATPSAGARVSGTVPLAVSVRTPDGHPVSSVQYLLDGAPLGSPVTTPPYTSAWQAAAAGSGTHLVSARVTDDAGNMSTAPVRTVTVTKQHSNSGPAGAPSVVLVNPAPGQAESGTVPLAAVVRDAAAGTVVQFRVDGRAVGPRITAPPYAIRWHTTAVAGGTHSVTATVTGSHGTAGTTASVPVSVVNPAPPMTCFILEADVAASGHGAVTSPNIHTASRGETLVAFVTARGATNHITVRGGKLRWQLVRRSAGTAGDAEAWTATSAAVRGGLHVTATDSSRASAETLRIIALEGVRGVGAASASSGTSSTPATSLRVTSSPSLVFSAGIDSTTPPSALPHGWVAGPNPTGGAGDGSWSQYTNQPAASPHAVVTVRDTSSAPGSWAVVAVELVGDGD